MHAAFTGCDTVSVIVGYGEKKRTLLKQKIPMRKPSVVKAKNQETKAS